MRRTRGWSVYSTIYIYNHVTEGLNYNITISICTVKLTRLAQGDPLMGSIFVNSPLMRLYFVRTT